MTTTSTPIPSSGTFALGGDLPVHRPGYGAMRITGKGIWGPPADLETARTVLRRAVELGVDVVSVQNRYNVTDTKAQDVVDYCEREGIAFIPWFPVAAGDLAKPGGVLDTLSKETGHTPAQLALAWLLRRSPVMLPIPGTGSLAHLEEENCAAATVELTDEQDAALTAAVG
jgi:aryl-alcohol dehydrogenase-like predicted oxidoreductase